MGIIKSQELFLEPLIEDAFNQKGFSLVTIILFNAVITFSVESTKALYEILV